MNSRFYVTRGFDGGYAVRMRLVRSEVASMLDPVQRLFKPWQEQEAYNYCEMMNTIQARNDEQQQQQEDPRAE